MANIDEIVETAKKEGSNYSEKRSIEIKNKTYLDENIDVVERSFKARKIYWDSHRFQVINEYIHKSVAYTEYGKDKIISLGSGPYEPVRINANYALDIAPNARKYLKEVGFKGKFILADCKEIPNKDKFYDVGVCSEVLEHLLTMDDVMQVIREVERTCKMWIFTTPCNPLGARNTEPTHKRFLGQDILKKLFKDYKVFITKDKIYYYIMKLDDEKKT